MRPQVLRVASCVLSSKSQAEAADTDAQDAMPDVILLKSVGEKAGQLDWKLLPAQEFFVARNCISATACVSVGLRRASFPGQLHCGGAESTSTALGGVAVVTESGVFAVAPGLTGWFQLMERARNERYRVLEKAAVQGRVACPLEWLVKSVPATNKLLVWTEYPTDVKDLAQDEAFPQVSQEDLDQT